MRSMHLNLVGLLIGSIAFTAARATPVLYPPPPAPYFPGIAVGGDGNYLYTEYNLAPPYDHLVGHHSSFVSTPGTPGVRYGVGDIGSGVQGLSTFDSATFTGGANAASAVRTGYGRTNSVGSELSLQTSDGLTPFSLDGSLPIGTPVTIQITLRLAGTDSVAIAGGGVGSVAGSASSTVQTDGVNLNLGFVVDPSRASATWNQSAIAFFVGYVGYTTLFSDRVYGSASANTSTDDTASGPESASIALNFTTDLSFSTAMSGVGLFSLSGAPYAEPRLVPEAPLLPLLAIGGVLMLANGRGRRIRSRDADEESTS